MADASVPTDLLELHLDLEDAGLNASAFPAGKIDADPEDSDDEGDSE